MTNKITTTKYAAAYNKLNNVRKTAKQLKITRDESQELYQSAKAEGLIASANPLNTKVFMDLYEKYKGLTRIAKNTDYTYYQIQKAYQAAKRKGLTMGQESGVGVSRDQRKNRKLTAAVAGKVAEMDTDKFALPAKGKVKRYIFTSAQNNTKLNLPVWKSLNALANHYDAEIYVSTFTYSKAMFRNDKDDLDMADWWDHRLVPHMLNERVEIAPDLILCGELNITPTAPRPLSGFEGYTGSASGIFPHIKFAMVSVPRGHDDPPKINYTTGTVTMRNYIQKKAGQKAEFHHCYGALLVEVDSKGVWFVRQLNASNSGVIHDLDVRVNKDKVTTGNRVEAILWGDVHVAQIDPTVDKVAWGKGGILDTLKPKEQHMGDVLDFQSQSYHDMQRPFRMFYKHVNKIENVAEEISEVGRFLKRSNRKWCKTVVIDSNHHQHLGKWLEQEKRTDPINVRFWLDMQSRIYAAIENNEKYNLLEDALKCVNFNVDDITFLAEDESHIICAQYGDGIECGMHGHLGPSGSRGTAIGLSKTGRKVNLGHSHAAGITDGAYVAGTCSTLKPDYVRGPSAWSWSHVVTYPNGKRAIITMRDGKWRV